MKSFASLTALALLCFVAAGCAEEETDATTSTDGGTPAAVGELGDAGDSTDTADATDTGDGEVVMVAVNANCPMNKEGASDGATTEFDGKTVGFCCEKCMAAWGEKTDEEKTALLAAVTTTEETTTDDGAGS